MNYGKIDISPTFARTSLRLSSLFIHGLCSVGLLALAIWGSVTNCSAQTQPAKQSGQNATSPRPRGDIGREMHEKMIRENPTYSEAVFRHRDPHEYLLEKEGSLNRSGPIPHLALALAAKAALEAGENEKAQDYAVKAIEGADREAASHKSRGYNNPRHFAGIPAVDYCANFVLGRLAILDGDIRSAERYLVASGKADGAGDPVLSSYGPNLSLALEVLKHGDQQSLEVVLKFLDEIKIFWKIEPAPFDQWRTEILAGKLPDFLVVGPNLFN